MATIQITRNYNTSGKAMLVFAGKNDTPNITNNNAYAYLHFTAKS